MLNQKEKFEIVESLRPRSGHFIKELASILYKLDTEDILAKHYISVGKYSKGYASRVKLSGEYLGEIFLNAPKGNDAPRGGQDGDYITIKDTKKNREILQFAKEFIACMYGYNL